MDRFTQILQALLGLAFYVVAVLLFSKPEQLAIYTMLTSAGAGLLANMIPGPGQVSVRALQALERSKSDPPPKE